MSFCGGAAQLKRYVPMRAQSTLQGKLKRRENGS
jgi:hypothetical protein